MHNLGSVDIHKAQYLKPIFRLRNYLHQREFRPDRQQPGRGRPSGGQSGGGSGGQSGGQQPPRRPRKPKRNDFWD